MTAQLLPPDFDSLIDQAVQHFWGSRATGSRKRSARSQGGTRNQVTPGKNMDGFLRVVRSVATHCGIPDAAVFTAGRSALTLPGYYRPNKTWDVVIVHHCRLIAVMEFKSQVGSFGNNGNDRAEEAIGNAADLWVATAGGAYHPARHKHSVGGSASDPRPPFVGHLMLLEDSEKSTKPVQADSRHYPVLPEFEGASYAERYRILCERLMEQKLYSAASVMLSAAPVDGKQQPWTSLSPATDVRHLFAQLAAHLLVAAQL